MLLIRAVSERDIGQLLGLSADVGVGMTSMPADPETWHKRIAHSNDSFARTQAGPGEEQTYFMVMEELGSGRIVGTTALYSGVGTTQPFYSYKLSMLVQASEALGVTVQRQALFLVNDYTGASEMGSLYLAPDMRIEGNGRFLSRSRYLLLADFPERFGDPVIAEMRGWQNRAHNSPFWTHLGEKFFGIAFENADYHSAVKGSQIITDLMPRYPIYVDLLPRAAQRAIGRPHADSLPALKLLEREGFRYEGYVDVFDGGPTVCCERELIQSVANSRSGVFSAIAETESEELYLVSNCSLECYRMVRTPLVIGEDERVLLPREAATALQLLSGDPVRFVEV